MLAALLAKTHNLSAYDQLCRRILAACTDTKNALVADEAAKACLLLPSRGANLEVISNLADTAVTRGVGDEGAMPFFQFCKALAEYRQGHFAGAVEWAQKPIRSPRVYAQGQAYAVLAMAQWQLGERDVARTLLAEGNRLAQRISQEADVQGSGRAWLGSVITRILFDEAVELIQPESSAANDSTDK